ncbi:hypothetical protein [Zobellia alginiliquefaciens]|uniref:hypothetical protein n=1 Tax=Zobellia alginiliquefaciens TaxID=3032586 RepID=UPI0023E3F74A|nr:hypothetical protein [Zobellia alginiliquefaciens]
MKKIFLKFNFIAALLLVVLITSCDAIVDQDEVDFGKGPILAQFQNTTDELNIIKNPNISFIDYEIPITYFGGRNEVLDRDVEVTIATSADSEAQEGVDFELTSTSLTIPAGENTANTSVRILTTDLVPFDFKDIILEITSSSEAVSDVNSMNLTLKTLDENTLAGTYDVEEGQYWNSGSLAGNYSGTVSIEAVSPDLYRHVGIGFWPEDNDFYFTVDPATNVITVLDKDLEGEPTLLNGSPIMTCAGGKFESVVCDETTTNQELKPDGKHIVKITTGYFRGAGATREFTETLVRQN